LLLLEERVVVLDEVLGGLWGLVGEESGGRYERVVRGFERWVGRVEGVMAGRRNGLNGEGGGQEEPGGGGGGGAGELVLIGEMDGAWRDECGALVRRLGEWRRKLRELELGSDVPPSAMEGEVEGAGGSSLARILAGCRALVHGMLAELDIMEQIEREAVAEEMRWVREMNRHGLDQDTPRAGAMWRVL
jgi:hypothetical protein